MNPDLTILVAEDTQSDALFMARAFRKLGLKQPVQIVSDGREVIRYLSGEGQYADRSRFPLPGVLYTDIKMPFADGFDVLAWLKNHPECAVIPTVVFSDSGHVKDVTRAYELGANAYFVKPGTLEELEELVRISCQFWAKCAQPPVSQSGPASRSLAARN